MCCLQGSWKIGVCLVVMYVKIFQVNWGVSILQNQQKVSHRKKKVCLKWYRIFSCQRSCIFLWYQILFQFWIHQVSYQLLLQVIFLLFQCQCWLCFSSSFIEAFIVTCCERKKILSWEYIFDENLLLSSCIWSDKVCIWIRVACFFSIFISCLGILSIKRPVILWL